jgi:hypothetical protein
MTDYDPNYAPDEDPLDDNPQVTRAGNRLAVIILVAIGLGVVLFFVFGIALACGAPGASCIWPFNH